MIDGKGWEVTAITGIAFECGFETIENASWSPRGCLVARLDRQRNFHGVNDAEEQGLRAREYCHDD